jgi:hypothetical protein
MALVTKLVHQVLQSRTRHSTADCTFDVVTDEAGDRYLQLDTYGSMTRKMAGKKSQSLRLAPSAIAQLKKILQEHQL